MPDAAAAEALGKIKARSPLPLIADIHFDHRLALACLKAGVDGLRINPGNIGGRKKVEEVVRAARERAVPIRIGVNSGSLEKDLLARYGGATAEAMAESALRHIRILEDLDYRSIKVSLKASDVPRTVEAYRRLAGKVDYPFHAGITEAGTAKIVSSHEYASQMPAVILGIKKLFNDNREEVHGLLAASFQAADQLKAFDAARRKAGEISAKIYNDQNGDYWYGYYMGVRDPKTGQLLGGSAVFNLEDNVNYFGLDGKHNNNMRATYETFGKIATQNYPQLFKDNPIPPYKEAVDTSFIFGAQALLNTSGIQGASAETVDYAKQAASGTVVGHKAVYINFASGSDQPLPNSLPTLNDLKDALAINSQLALQIDGYTDDAGSDAVNVPLSEKRAMAVKHYFQQVAPMSFPEARFKGVAGHGSQDPIASNAAAGGKALNRRVEITQIGQ